ncbi:MAG: PaaI family thioesterase [Solirubrobacterales bacterium]|nr:PaaI family thioesterase [Solirubrobacterales bacterium]
MAGDLDALLGLELHAVSAEEVTATVAVRDQVRQPWGIVHGGLYAAVAESLASRGTFHGVADAGLVPLGISNATSFLRPIAAGSVHARALRRHGGRTTWVWDVELSDDQGRLCALARVTVAVRPRPGDSGW